MKLAFASLLGGEDTYDAVLDKSGIEESPTGDDIVFSKSILDGILEHCDEIDALIDELAIGWKLERMPKVDLTILRVAIYEMKYRKDISHSVSINEAVELAKQFGGDRSSAYINGMLGTLARRLEEEEEEQ